MFRFMSEFDCVTRVGNINYFIFRWIIVDFTRIKDTKKFNTLLSVSQRIAPSSKYLTEKGALKPSNK